MIIFWRLLFGHLLADFTLQTNAVNHWKRSSFWGMLFHCATHPFIYILLTYPFLKLPWVNLGFLSLNGWTCIFLLFLGHWLEDVWRVHTIDRYKTPDNTLYFIWDQIIHYVAIFAVAPFLELSNPAKTFFPEKWPIMGSLFVLVTSMTAIFIYFVEKDLFSSPFPKTFEKYAGMAERLILALCVLAPGNLWLFFIPTWIFIMAFIRLKKWVKFSWTSFYLGVLIAIFCGSTARILYHHNEDQISGMACVKQIGTVPI